ncbi:MAG: DUF1194 domain-containing protein, partial [Rhodobacter sp.]|nr:DUF1194 domain-containing protein [Rhodobacter sp.]
MRHLIAILAVLSLAAPAAASEIEVDLELLLLVDVSRSMSPAELEIQRRGYAEALTSNAVFVALQSGALQSIAVSYVEWAGSDLQNIVVDWRVLQTRADLAAFARVLTARFSHSMRRTSISGALEYGADSLAGNIYAGLRQVIDISGDGPNNNGRPVTGARDAAVMRGITINGLPLMTEDGSGSYYRLDDLDAYYRACVIGGPGAFVIPVLDWRDFASAVRRKL